MRDVRNKSRWSLAFTLILAGGLLFLALRGVNWQEMLGTIQQARLEYLALGCTVASASYFIRGLRWRVLLSAGKQIAPLTVFWATMLGYLGNSFLPARAGELIRSVMLGRRLDISASFVLATALTERIIDVVALVLIGSVSLLSMKGMPEILLTTVKLMAGLGLVGLAGVFVAPSLQNWFKQILNRLPLPTKWRACLLSLMEQFLLGMRTMQHPGRALGFIGLTGVIWLMDSVGSTIGARALNLTLTLPQALILLAALGLSSTVPSTPGYVGIYQFVAVTVLPSFGFSRSQALTYIIVSQALYYGVVTAWGLLGLWRLGATGSGALPIWKQKRQL